MATLAIQNELKLNYEVAGNGDVTFLLFNGAGLPLQFWGGFAKKLADRCRVVRFDQRNAGETEFNGQFSLTDVASDAARLLDSLETERVVVIAHAWGGRAAQVFVRDYPHRVDAMVICGTGGHLPARVDPEDMSQLIEARRNNDLTVWREKIEKVYCGPGFSQRDPETFDEICQVMLDFPPSREARWNMKIAPTSTYWGTAEVPALLIYGAHDKNGTPENALDLHERLYNSKLMMIEHAGHFVVREAEAEILAAVAQFADL